MLPCFHRRAAGSKFVPPVRREESEGRERGRETCLDAVRSRVQYGGPSSSTGGGTGAGGLPPELEGNERLKNIEPRMVELITNEVHVIHTLLQGIWHSQPCSYSNTSVFAC